MQSKRRKVTWIALVSSCALLTSLLTLVFSQGIAHGQTTRARSARINPGHYTVITSYLTGIKGGTSAQGTYDIVMTSPLVTLTVQFPEGSGHGIIVLDGPHNTAFLTFRVALSPTISIQVSQDITQIFPSGFISQGFGVLYINDVPQLPQYNMTRSVATLTP
ncbi:MAG TPA: hypothetical protein VGF67_24505 [Ktedonobacteraceae bacterium]|jgi:hypothetical protein